MASFRASLAGEEIEAQTDLGFLTVNTGLEMRDVYELTAEEEAPKEALYSDLISIHADGKRVPLFMMQSWKNEIPKIQRFARYLGKDQPIYSVNPPHGKNREDYPRRSSDWSDYCLDMVEKVGYSGPWRLGGWSWGGTLSLGIANSLVARGEEVQMVMLFDSALPRTPQAVDRKKKLSLLHRTVNSAHEYYQEPEAERRALLAKKVSFWKRRVSRRVGGNQQEWLDDRKSRMGWLQRALHVSYLNYEPFYCDVPVCLLWTDESMAKTKDLSLGWSRYLRGPFWSCRAATEHVSMWDEPHVETVAEMTNQMLSRLP